MRCIYCGCTVWSDDGNVCDSCQPGTTSNDDVGVVSYTERRKQEATTDLPASPQSDVEGDGSCAAASCPCTYLEIPCQPDCTCRNPMMSHGCLYCCSYGSIKQRQDKAQWIANAIIAAVAHEDLMAGFGPDFNPEEYTPEGNHAGSTDGTLTSVEPLVTAVPKTSILEAQDE